MPITLTQQNLSLAEVISVARNFDTVELSIEIRDKLAATRQFIEQNWMHDEAPLIYSFNTGVGLFKDRRIALSDIPRFQTNLILSHATGVGEPLSIEAARTVMLLRLNAFKSDHSGVSLAVVERLLDFLNLQLTPVIPVKGSVGASGDLAPLAHMSGALCGFDEAEIGEDGAEEGDGEAAIEAGGEPKADSVGVAADVAEEGDAGDVAEQDDADTGDSTDDSSEDTPS